MVPPPLPHIHQTAISVSQGLCNPIKTTARFSTSLLLRPPVGLRGTGWRPEPAESRPYQLPADKEDHQRGRSEGGNSPCRRLLLRSLPLARLAHPSYRQSGAQTDELLPYLAFSLLSLPRHQITFLNTQLDRHCMKVSKVADSLMSYTEQFMEYDPFVAAIEPSNPWLSDDTAFWDLEARWGTMFGCGIVLQTHAEVRRSVDVSALIKISCPNSEGMRWFFCVLTSWPQLSIEQEGKWLVNNKPLSYLILFYSILC